MASRQAAEDGGLPGPWLASPGEDSPIWGWSGEEETLPLLEFENEEEVPDPEKVLSRPWTFDNTNPFVGNVSTPLKPQPQENIETVPLEIPVDVPVTINEDKFEPLNRPGLLFPATARYIANLYIMILPSLCPSRCLVYHCLSS